jgi:hypothetical protein
MGKTITETWSLGQPHLVFKVDGLKKDQRLVLETNEPLKRNHVVLSANDGIAVAPLGNEVNEITASFWLQNGIRVEVCIPPPARPVAHP